MVAGTTTTSGAPVSNARTRSAHAASQRGFSGRLRTAATTPSSTAWRRSPRSGRSAPAGSASSVSGSGRSIRSRLASSSSPGPSPTAPRTSRESTSLEEPAAVANAIRHSVMSQLRGDGQGPPRRVSPLGSRCTSAGRAVRSPHTARRAKSTASGSRSGASRGSVALGQVPPRPRTTTSWSWVHWRCTNRLASGGLSSQPSAAEERGLAAATIRTPGGSCSAPIRRSSTRRSRAAWTVGGAVDSSSRNSSPRPARTSRTAQSGGAIGTPCSAGSSPTMGSPEKSDGSWTLAMTVVSGRSRDTASCVSAAVLPMPGSPHRSTGRSAATARARASSWMSGRGSVVVSRSRAVSSPAMPSWEARSWPEGEPDVTKGVRVSMSESPVGSW